MKFNFPKNDIIIIWCSYFFSGYKIHNESIVWEKTTRSVVHVSSVPSRVSTQFFIISHSRIYMVIWARLISISVWKIYCSCDDDTWIL